MGKSIKLNFKLKQASVLFEQNLGLECDKK